MTKVFAPKYTKAVLPISRRAAFFLFRVQRQHAVLAQPLLNGGEDLVERRAEEHARVLEQLVAGLLRKERREQQIRAYENQQKEIADTKAFCSC